MAASLVLRDLVMILREKRGGTGKHGHQLCQKGKECEELRDQCIAFGLDNDSLRYIMLC